MEIQDNIQWHPAFCSAVELELREYKKYLTYEREHNLGRMPLKIDLLITGSCDEGTRQGIPRMDHVPDTNAKQG